MLKICQIILICCIPMLAGKKLTGQELNAYITSYMEWDNYVYYQRPSAIEKEITDKETLLKAQKELGLLPGKPFNIFIENGDFDASDLIEKLTRCWQLYRNENQYSLSVTYTGDEENGKDAMTPFFSLMGDECVAKLEKELAKKDGFPEYIRLERVNELDIYTVCVKMPGQYEKEREYIVALNGVWEGQKVCWQYVTFPSAGGHDTFGSPFSSYFTASMDINYDCCSDLFIHEGYSSGSGGSWTVYRGIIWKEESGEFIWYDSFPAYVSDTEFTKQRMIKNYSMGVFEEHILEYKVVDGEYVVTRELAWIDDTLSYYEMGVLVKEYDTTDMSFEDICALYPDLDYWRRG